jgi:hypothetical protein
MMAVLERISGMALDAWEKKWEESLKREGKQKADEGMINFSEAFGRGYQKRTNI